MIAKFTIGQIVKHRFYAFRGIIYDVDPQYNPDECCDVIPSEIRPCEKQPYYHLLAQSETNTYEAYVAEQSLISDQSSGPVDHPLISEVLVEQDDGTYKLCPRRSH